MEHERVYSCHDIVRNKILIVFVLMSVLTISDNSLISACHDNLCVYNAYIASPLVK